MENLDQTISNIPGAGAAMAKKLCRLNIQNLRDLLYFFPYRYENYEERTKIKDLVPNQNYNVTGEIILIRNRKSQRKKLYITEALLGDDSGQLKIIWFNQPFIARTIGNGEKISLAGRVERDPGGLIMKSPVYEKFSDANIHTQGLIPMYHLSANITQKQIRFLVKKIIPLAGLIEEWLPEETLKRNGLITLPEAIKKIHFPKNMDEASAAKLRLAFGEVLLLQIKSQLIKKELEKSKSLKIIFKEKETKEFVSGLPFNLTPDQRKTAWEILLDLRLGRPMARLLQGDVGSGKTIVAMIAMFNVALNGLQAILMVPTEILAKQHYDNFNKYLKKYNISIGLLSRSEKSINRPAEKADADFISKHARIIIGTHAIIQEKINFEKLALACIDEQHRFGVKQRKTLIKKSGLKGKTPHLLSMTATPIPRSLTLALYGDLNLSLIKTMPEGRLPIKTKLVNEDDREKAYDFVKNQINRGRQAFVVCPLIDISDKLGVRSVNEEYKKLKTLVFPGQKIEVLHGRLKTEEKNRIMDEFLKNKISILVTTSVIEVGVDVPNATIILIEGADRFGLAQLHQFRGRVGRADKESYCFLFSDNESLKSTERLKALEKTDNGLLLAKIDLKLRGPGEVYGTIQKGFPELRVASLFDYALMKSAAEEAEKIVLLNWEKLTKLEEKIKEIKKTIHPE